MSERDQTQARIVELEAQLKEQERKHRHANNIWEVRLRYAMRGLEVTNRELATATSQMATKNKELSALRQNLEEQNQVLQTAMAAAEAASQAKSNFLANISHELRTPLALVTGPLQAIPMGPGSNLPQEVKREIQRADRNATRLLGLVNDLLDFSKAEAGMMPVIVEEFDLAEAAASLIDDTQAIADSTGVELVAQLPETPTTIVADRQKTERVLLNLLRNALKFTPKGGTITVVLDPSGDDCVISVTDTGIGIPEDKLETIFERFQQVDATSTRRYGGTGLGLALVREFVSLQQGSVNVESTIGEGSKFTIRLPKRVTGERVAESRESEITSDLQPSSRRVLLASDAGRKLEAPEAPPIPRSGSKRGRVLVAEDNADMRAFICDVLGEQFDVEGVENGRLALEAARANPPQVVVSDVMMPEMDGNELVAHLKADTELRNSLIILLTAQAAHDDVAQSLHGGADGYLTKPFAPGELVARVAAAVRIHSLHEDLQAKQKHIAKLEKEALEVQMAGGFAHEIRNILTAVTATLARGLGLAAGNTALTERNAESLHRLFEGIRGELSASALRQAAEELHNVADTEMTLDSVLRDAMGHTRRALGVAAEIMEYARLGKTQRGTEEVDIVPLVQGIVDEMSSEFEEKKIEVAQDLPPSCILVGQQLHYYSIFKNLIMNAKDALAVTTDGRRRQIGVELKADNDSILAAVRDNGCGMSDQQVGRIFEPFFSTKPDSGTGLGLGVVRKLTQLNGGEVGVESQLGAGSTFQISFTNKESTAETDDPMQSVA